MSVPLKVHHSPLPRLLAKGIQVSVYSLGERQVEFRGEEWFIGKHLIVGSNTLIPEGKSFSRAC